MPRILLFILLGILSSLSGAESENPEKLFLSPGENSRIIRWTARVFPDYVRKSSAEFGWRIYRLQGGWQELPEKLPVHNTAVLMQGLDDTGKTWMNLAPALTRDGWTVLELRYPNDQPILNSTAYLFDGLLQLRSLGMESFVLIGHSMGGLISRCLLSFPVFNYRNNAASGTFPRCRYLIQVGPPNHGSGWAHLRILSEWREHAYKFTQGGSLLGGLMDGNGEAGKDLLPDSPFIRRLNSSPLPPDLPVTIIAGVVAPVSSSSIQETWSLWQKRKAAYAADQIIPAEQIWHLSSLLGDGAVPLQSTRIQGVRDYMIFHASHLFLIRNISLKSQRIPPAVPVIRQRLQSVYQQEITSNDQQP